MVAYAHGNAGQPEPSQPIEVGTQGEQLDQNADLPRANDAVRARDVGVEDRVTAYRELAFLEPYRDRRGCGVGWNGSP
jgi:hypothetical protein